MNLTKDDIVAFCDRHPDIAKTPDNFMIAYEWVCTRDLQPTTANLDLAYSVNQNHFEPRPPTEEEVARLSSDAYLHRVVIPEFERMQSATKPVPETIDGYTPEEVEEMSAEDYRRALKLKRGPKMFSQSRSL